MSIYDHEDSFGKWADTQRPEIYPLEKRAVSYKPPQGQDDITLESLSKTQTHVLRWIANDQCATQIAGHSCAPYLSAGHALVRKGLAWTHRTGWFGVTDKGMELIANSVEKGNEKQ